jgi:hypothetical protein
MPHPQERGAPVSFWRHVALWRCGGHFRLEKILVRSDRPNRITFPEVLASNVRLPVPENFGVKISCAASRRGRAAGKGLDPRPHSESLRLVDSE